MKIHRYLANLFPVNAYLIEADDGLIAVDTTLGVSDGRRLAAMADALHKPWLGAVITHCHPDHYGALASFLDGRDLPVYALPGVRAAIERDDAAKEAILRPMFGEEWAPTRAFPNHGVADGALVTLGTTQLRAVDVGPCESPHDSWWLVERSDGPPAAFVGDLVYNRMHVYLADGFYESWLRNLQRARRELPPDATLYMGHGEPVPGAQGKGLLDWQTGYMERFLDAMQAGRNQGLAGNALVQSVTAKLQSYLPGDELLFLMQLSVAALQERFAIQQGTTH